jgi:hypothetical protein
VILAVLRNGPLDAVVVDAARASFRAPLERVDRCR